ncbi:MAG: universal stress protein [Deltaproteobacteria bacterium]|nr:universal stress protein [Deltaproteobacteria bacterium]
MDLHAFLVATDFSECSAAAFQMAKKLAQGFGAKIILLHVINQRLVEQMASHLRVEVDTLGSEFREQAQLHLGEFLKQVKPGDLEVESMVAIGAPFQEIAVVARDLLVDLVVMGGYGRGGRGSIEQVFFGSTAEKVVRLLPCPVLCVPLTVSGEQ